MAQQLWYPREFKEKFDLEGQRFIQALIDKLQSLEANPVGLGTFLASLNQLTPSANQFPYATGANSAAFADVTAFARTLLDDASAAAVLNTLGVSSFIQTLLDDTTAAEARATLGAGGMRLVDTDEADGSAEHLQVTDETSTLSGIRRMEAYFRDIVPEIDGDQLNFSVILDDDSEYSTFVRFQFWGLGDATFASNKLTNSVFGIGDLGTGTSESLNVKIELLTGNGDFAQKVVKLTRVQDNASEVDIWREHVLKIASTKSIKGFRWDTDNAGDMLDAGTAELFVQT